MKKEWMDSPIVKTLLESGLSEDYIEKAIANKDILIDEEEKEEKKEGEGKDDNEDKKEKKVEKQEDIEKSIENAFEKSFSGLGEIMKSAMLEVTTPLLEKISNLEKNLQKSVPEFKAPLNMAVIEKSIDSEGNEKTEATISVSQQRNVVRNLISSALEQAPEDIRKSLESDSLDFLMNPYADTVGANLAQHIYKSYNIKLAK